MEGIENKKCSKEEGLEKVVKLEVECLKKEFLEEYWWKGLEENFRGWMGT